MKSARWLLLTLAILLVLAGAVCGLALLPSVQRWAVLRATADVPGLTFDVAEVSVGLSGLTLKRVQAEKSRVAVKAETVEADFSLTAFLFGRRLEISRLVVTGLDVDATRVSRDKAGAAAAGAPAVTPGLLANARLPFDLVLDDVRIEGRARMAGATNQPPLDGRFVITGGQIAPGHEGLLQLDAAVNNPAPATGVTTLRVQAGLRATLSNQRTFDKISLATVVDASGPSLSSESQLKLGAELFRSSAGENYEVSVETVIAGTRENIAKFHAQLPSAGGQYGGDWELKVRTSQVEPFLLGHSLPTFDLKGGGKFALEPKGAAFSLQGALQAQLSRLEAIDPAWREIGPIKVDATFDGGQQDGVLQLGELKALVTGATPLIEARTTTPIRYDMRKRQLLTTATGPESLLQVALTGVPVDWVRPFVAAADISGGMITGEFDLAPVTGTVTAVAVRGRIQANEVTVTQDGRPLLSRAAVSLRTEATLSDTALDAPVLELTVSTPEGDALNLSGRLSRALTPNPPLTFAGTLTASSSRLLSRWLPGAPVKAEGEVNVTLRGEVLEAQPGRLQLQQAGKSLFEATILQPCSVNLGTHALVLQDPARPVAKVALGRLPLGLLPLTDPAATLGGFVEQGEFELSVRGGKTLVRPLGLLRFSNVSLLQNRRQVLSALAIEAMPQIEYGSPEDFRMQSGDVTVRAAGKGELLSLTAEATATPGQGTQATVSFALEASALATQPLFAEAQALSAGKATGEIRAVLAGTRQVEARVTLNGLVAADSSLTFPVANIGFRSITQTNGLVSIQLPVLLDNAGRRSDLNFALALSPLGGGYSVDGKISGQQVDWEDMQSILGVFLASVAPDSDDRPVLTPTGVTPDTAAVWSQFSGQVAVDIKSVTHGKEWAMTGLAGTLAIEPTRLSLPKLTAAFGETSRLNAKLEARFTGGPMPYRITGDYALNDFDMGALIKALEATTSPTVEGLFNVNSSFTGNGETLQRAIDRVHGEFQLTSHQGVFRGLQRSVDKVSMATKAVDFISSMLSNKVGKAAEKVAGTAVYVDQLAQSLAELNYDLLSVKLTRDAQLNLNLQDFTLVSSELRLNGQAEVTYESGKSLLEQPLSSSLDLAARGKIEEQLEKLHLLSGTKDELGYAKGKYIVTLGGTLGRPDSSAFFAKIAAEKLSELLEPAD